MIGLKNRLLAALAALLMFAAPVQAQQGTSYTPPLTLGAGVATALGFAPNTGGGFVLYSSLGTGAFVGAYSLPTASTSTLGGVKVDGTTITISGGVISSAGGYTLPAATSSVLGGVQIGSNLTITAGVLSLTSANVTGALGFTPLSAPGTGVATALAAATDTTGGVVLLNGTPTSGDLLQWSATGAQDSNVAASSVVTLGATQTLTNKVLTSPAFTGTVTGAGTIPVGVISATGTPSSTTFLRGDGTWNAGSGGITGPGTTVVGNIAAWNSTTGASLLDTGISASGNSITGSSSAPFVVTAGTGKVLNLGGNATPQWTIGLGGYLYPNTALGIGLTGTNWLASIATNNVYLAGSSTGFDIIQSGNTGTGNWTYKTPPATGTGSDTLVTLGATQTFSGANTFSGTVAHSGANTFSSTTLFSGSAPTMTANTTSIIGGSTSPTYPAATGGVMTFGGLLSAAPTLNSTGSGAVYSTTSGGLTFSGYGSSNDYTFNSHTGSSLGSIASNGLWSMNSARTGSIANSTSTHLWISGAAPTVTSGFGTVQGSIGTVNGTLRFDVNTNVGTTGATGVVGLAAATTDWMCKAQSKNNAATLQVIQTGYATTSATFAPYTLAGVLSAWIAADVIAISCVAN